MQRAGLDSAKPSDLSRSSRKTRASRNLRRSTRPTLPSWSRSNAQGCTRCPAQQPRVRRWPEPVEEVQRFGAGAMANAQGLPSPSLDALVAKIWYFHHNGIMEEKDVVRSLAALAQSHRLRI